VARGAARSEGARTTARGGDHAESNRARPACDLASWSSRTLR
jgi:hypothetical protein